MLSILFMLFIIIASSSPLWITILLLVIGAKNTKPSDCSKESDDDYFPIAVICD